MTFRGELFPAKVAYLIQYGSSLGFRRSVQEASSRWGGIKEPIIPVRKGGSIDPWWLQVIGLAEIHALVNVDIEKSEEESIASKLKLPIVSIAEIDTFQSPSCFTSNPASLRVSGQPPFILPKKDAPLWQIVAAGDLTTENEESLRSANIPLLRQDFPDFIARSSITGTTIIDATGVDISENWAQNVSGEYPALIWVTEPESLKDCLWFWNLRVLAPVTFSPAPMFILPIDDVKYWLNFAPHIGSAFARKDEFSPDVIVGTSSSKNRRKLAKFAESLDLRPSQEKPRAGHRFPAPPREMPYTYLTNLDYRQFIIFERRYGKVATFDGYIANGSVNLKFRSPVNFTGPGFAKLRLTNKSFDSFPKSPVLAQSILQNATWDKYGLVVNTNAQTEYELTIAIPSLEEATFTLLKALPGSFEISDKGKVGNALLSLGTTSALLLQGAHETISRLTTPRAKELLKELRRSRKKGASDTDLVEMASLWGGRSERRSLSTDDLPKFPNALPVEELCAAGWAERGLQLLCRRCGRPSFISFANVTDQPTCPGCGSHEEFSLSKNGLRVFYRLNTFIDFASDQGIIPHVLSREALVKADSRTFLIPGLNVSLMDGASFEVDLFGIHSGRILSGEVKTNPAEFTQVQIRRDVLKSKAIQAEVHLMASMSSLTPEQFEFAEKMTKREKLELLVLGPKELTPA